MSDWSEDLITKITDEVDLPKHDEKTIRKLWFWINSVYKDVVMAEEYSWRKRDNYILTTQGPLATMLQVTPGETYVGIIGEDPAFPETVSTEIVKNTPIENNYFILRKFPLGDLVSSAPFRVLNRALSFLEMQQPYPGDSKVTYIADLYYPSYAINGVKEDWIINIYEGDAEDPIDRVFPADYKSYINWSLDKPGRPYNYFVSGTDSDGNARIHFVPTPNEEYIFRCEILLGPEELNTDTTNTIIPDAFETELLVFGTCMLYNGSLRDEDGLKFYGSQFGRKLSKMIKDSGKEPGAANRIMGNLRRKMVSWDSNIPLKWEY